MYKTDTTRYCNKREHILLTCLQYVILMCHSSISAYSIFYFPYNSHNSPKQSIGQRCTLKSILSSYFPGSWWQTFLYPVFFNLMCTQSQIKVLETAHMCLLVFSESRVVHAGVCQGELAVASHVKGQTRDTQRDK